MLTYAFEHNLLATGQDAAGWRELAYVEHDGQTEVTIVEQTRRITPQLHTSAYVSIRQHP
jgi:hypothetical protein